MKKILLLICLTAIFGVVAGEPIVPEIEVQTIVVKEHPLDLTSEWIGSADGQINVTISAQVSGYLFKQNYEEGGLVKKGDVIFELDDRTFVAQANLAKAQYKQAEANKITAEKDFVRAQDLLKEAVIPLREFEQRTNAKLTMEAGVEVAQANVEIANLNLSFTKIIAPVDGIAGRAQVKVGDLITPQTAMATVSKVDPLRVFVAVSEREYLDYALLPEAEQLPMVLTLQLANGKIHPHQGKFVFIDRQVDQQTGVIQVAADFPNPDFSLRPGIFARVKAITAHVEKAITIPQRAISDLQGKKIVAVLDANNRVTLRNVTAKQQVGNEWLIEEGLKDGETIVVEGLQKVREGVLVKPTPYQ